MLLLNVFADALNFFSSFFEGTNFAYIFDMTWFTAISDIIKVIAWILPLPTIISIFTISVALLFIRIGVAIWKLLPLT